MKMYIVYEEFDNSAQFVSLDRHEAIEAPGVALLLALKHI